LGQTDQVSELVDKPYRKCKQTFDNVIVESSCYASDTAKNELTDNRVVHFVKVELVVNNLVYTTAVCFVESALNLGPRACVKQPSNDEGDNGNAYCDKREPFGVFELHQLRNIQLSWHKEILENSFAEDTAQKRRNCKNHNRERHGEIFVNVPGLDAFVTRFPVEGEEEQAEHVERREAAREECETEYHIMLSLECGEDDFVFREESGERRNARNRKNRNECANVSELHLFAEPAHGIEIVRADLMD